MTGLDPLHIALMVTVGLISTLFSIVAFFLQRDYKTRDRRDEQLIATLTNIQDVASSMEGRVGRLEQGWSDNHDRIRAIEAEVREALTIANFLKGKAET